MVYGCYVVAIRTAFLFGCHVITLSLPRGWQVSGMLSASLLAREALLAARQLSIRQGRGAQLWVGSEGLSLTRAVVEDRAVARCEPPPTILLTIDPRTNLSIISPQFQLKNRSWGGVFHLVRLEWVASVGVHLLECICWSAPVGVHLLECTCWSAPVGVHLLECICWSAPVGVSYARASRGVSVWLECELVASGNASASVTSRRQFLDRKPQSATTATTGMRLEFNFREAVHIDVRSRIGITLKNAARLGGQQGNAASAALACVVFRLMAATEALPPSCTARDARSHHSPPRATVTHTTGHRHSYHGAPSLIPRITRTTYHHRLHHIPPSLTPRAAITHTTSHHHAHRIPPSRTAHTTITHTTYHHHSRHIPPSLTPRITAHRRDPPGGRGAESAARKSTGSRELGRTQLPLIDALHQVPPPEPSTPP